MKEVLFETLFTALKMNVRQITRAETILENTYVIKIKTVVGRLICYGEKISCNYHKVVVLHGID